MGALDMLDVLGSHGMVCYFSRVVVIGGFSHARFVDDF
jgi:hypothetical protein